MRIVETARLARSQHKRSRCRSPTEACAATTVRFGLAGSSFSAHNLRRRPLWLRTPPSSLTEIISSRQPSKLREIKFRSGARLRRWQHLTAMDDRRYFLPALGTALLVGCASTQHTMQDNVPRARGPAEAAFAASLAPAAGLDRPLKALHTPFPDFPSWLRNAAAAGPVRTQFTIRADGSVSDPTVLGSPNPELAALVLKSVLTWRFEPPVRNGTPTSVRARHEFVFKVE